ncbi:MAG TPA: PAS domain S-box protein [Chitinophagaceae bacterium]|nr:PAS domain S-box protein [Chitinophagaceae bacterium]
MKPVTGKALKIVIFLILMTILVFVFILLQQASHLKYTAANLARTNEVLYQSQKVLAATTENKIIARDFLLTGNDKYLQSLEKSNVSIFSAIAQLKKLTVGNSPQQVRIASLLQYINKNIELSNSIISLREKHGQSQAALLADKIGESKYADPIQQIILQIEDTEKVLLNQRKEANQLSGLYLDNLMRWLIVIILILVVFVILNTRIDFLSLKKAERKLSESQDHLVRFKEELEEKVRLKTAELTGIFERISDAFIAFDKNWRCTYVNKKAGELIKRVPASLIGKNVWAEFPDVVGSAIYEIFHKSFREQQYFDNAGYYEPFDLWLENHVYPSPDGISVFIKDITDKKKAEEKIITNEKRFRALLRNSTNGLTLVDANGSVIDISPSGNKILGYSYEELVGKAHPELIHAEDMPEVMQAFTKIKEEPAGIILLEYRHMMPDGSYKWLECSYNNLLEEPYINAVVLNYRDITERKNAEEKMRINEQMLSRAEEIGQFGSWEYDAITNKIKWSDSMYRIHGLDKGQPVSLDVFFQQLHSADVAKLKIAFKNLTEKEQRLKNEYRFKKGGDEIRYARTTLDAIFENGKLSKALGVIQDITEQKLADEKLRRSEHKYRLLFENNPMPMWMSSIPELNIIDVNEAALKQYGYTREEFLGLSSMEMRPQEDMGAFLKDPDKMAPDSDTTMQCRHKKKDGTIMYVEIFNYQIVYEDMPVLLGLSIDITEKTRAEKLLKKSYEDIRQLASHLQNVREEERAHIAREIHDELGQQLTGLKMDISWLNRKKDIDEKQRDQKIKEILALLDGAVNTVRKLSAELRPGILDDLGLVEALEWWSNEFEKRTGIVCSFQGPEQSLQVPANVAIGLFRIYQESLNNVAKHANAKKVFVQLEAENNQLILKIADDGKGFDTSNTGHKKTLGLLGMKERTLMMGGSYEIKSQPGNGTTVTIAAPFEILNNV